MQTVTLERRIAAPVEAVFDWISNAHNYTRTVLVLHEHRARDGADAPYGLGAVRVLGWLIGWFWERITAYDAPHSFEYDVYRSIPPSRHEGGRVSFTEIDGITTVVWTSTFEVRLPILGALLTRMARPVVAFSFGRVLAAAARALELRVPDNQDFS